VSASGSADSVTARAGLEELSDNDLLAYCRKQPRASAEWTEACDVLVRRYTPLVRALVRQYRESPESVDDLMQVGYLGLLKAIGNYDPAFGNGLRAYAVPCISGELKRHFRDKRWQVKVTRPVQELLLEMRGAIEDLTHEIGRVPTDSELAARLGVTPDELREARQAAEAFSALSLDAPVGGDDDSGELGDLLGGEDAGVEQAVDMEAIAQHWGELPRREQRILILRFYGNLTQEEVAARLGISQMHVSRLQARALARLRDWLLGPADAHPSEGEAEGRPISAARSVPPATPLDGPARLRSAGALRGGDQGDVTAAFLA
jgi:RNA polymerase sigma-B factor